MLASAPEMVNAPPIPSERGLLWAGGLLALGLRMALIAAGHGQPPQRWEYSALAASLLAGRGLAHEHLFGVTYRAYYSGLGYLGLSAGCEWLAPGQAWPVQAVQALSSVAAGALAFALARRVAPARMAGLAACATWFHPGLVHYDVAQLHPLSLDAACGLLAAWTTLRAAESARLSRVVWAGAALGLAILQRGSLLPLLVLWPLAVRRRPVALAALAALVPLGAWATRNLCVLGQPLLTSTSGEHFWIGNAPGSTGGALFAGGKPVIDELPPDLAARLAATGELGQSRAFWQAGLAEAAGHPTGFATGMLAKAARFWSLAPQTGARYPPGWSLAYLAFGSALLALAVLGARRLWRGGNPGARALVALLVASLLAVSAVHAVFYFELRHRFALDPLLAVLAAGLARRRAQV